MIIPVLFNWALTGARSSLTGIKLEVYRNLSYFTNEIIFLFCEPSMNASPRVANVFEVPMKFSRV